MTAPDDLTPDDSAFWDYIPGFEPPERYDAFAHYRDTGPARRTLSGTARALGLGPGTITRWAREGLWAERCASYDTHRTREREAMRAAAEAAVDADWATKRADLLAELHEIATTGAAQLAHRLRTRGGELRPNELVQVARVLMHFGNLANGDATEKVDGLPDLTNMNDEQLRAFRAATETVRKTLGSNDDDGHD